MVPLIVSADVKLAVTSTPEYVAIFAVVGTASVLAAVATASLQLVK